MRHRWEMEGSMSLRVGELCFPSFVVAVAVCRFHFHFQADYIYSLEAPDERCLCSVIVLFALLLILNHQAPSLVPISAPFQDARPAPSQVERASLAALESNEYAVS